MSSFRSLFSATVALLLAAGLVGGGCSLVSSDSPSADVPPVNVSVSDDTVRVSQSTHDDATRIEFAVTADFTNNLSDSLTVLGCPPPSTPLVERKTDDGWTLALAPIEFSCLARKRIAPGKTITVGGTYSAYLPGDHNNEPVFRGPIDGTYRLRIPRNDLEDADALSNADLISDTFRMESR